MVKAYRRWRRWHSDRELEILRRKAYEMNISFRRVIKFADTDVYLKERLLKLRDSLV
ncbi:MAG: hypothetical protein N2511_08815 [Thermodesulfovibrionales bacterium]|nr:hypothetical protein [Thermodesulfovibrionales bacterium]